MTVRRTGVAALAGMLTLALPTAVAAQGTQAMPLVIRDGRTVWVTSLDGREQKGRLMVITPTEVLLRTTGQQVTTIRVDQVRRIEAQDGIGDGVRTGALIGGGIYAPLWLSWVAACDIGCDGSLPYALLSIGMGAGIGAGIGACADAMVTRREVLFVRSGTAGTSLRPMLSSSFVGARLTIGW
jgi:hypothetical protein